MKLMTAALVFLAGLSQQIPALVKLPTVVKGAFDASDGTAPVSFTLNKPSKVRVMLECDTCAPRLSLMDANGKVLKRNENWVTAFVEANLNAGSYVVWATTAPDRRGDYILTLSDGEQDIIPVLQTFLSVNASYRAGTRTIKGYGGVRVGTSTLSVELKNSKVFKSLKLADVVAIEASTTTSSNMASRALLGQLASDSTQALWITVRTANEHIVLDVAAKDYAILLAALKTATGKH